MSRTILCPGLFCVQDYSVSRTILCPGLFCVQDYFVSRGKNSVSRRRNPSLAHAPDPADPPDPPDWCHQVPPRPSLPHAPGVRMMAATTNSLKLNITKQTYDCSLWFTILLNNILLVSNMLRALMLQKYSL